MFIVTQESRHALEPPRLHHEPDCRDQMTARNRPDTPCPFRSGFAAAGRNTHRLTPLGAISAIFAPGWGNKQRIPKKTCLSRHYDQPAMMRVNRSFPRRIGGPFPTGRVSDPLRSVNSGSPFGVAFGLFSTAALGQAHAAIRGQQSLETTRPLSAGNVRPELCSIKRPRQKSGAMCLTGWRGSACRPAPGSADTRAGTGDATSGRSMHQRVVYELGGIAIAGGQIGGTSQLQDTG
jgi:hypothetical protein